MTPATGPDGWRRVRASQLATIAPRSTSRTAVRVSIRTVSLDIFGMHEIQIAEAGEFGLEQQRDRPRRAMPLLGDNQVGPVVRLGHALLPIIHCGVEFVRAAVEGNLLRHLLLKI